MIKKEILLDMFLFLCLLMTLSGCKKQSGEETYSTDVSGAAGNGGIPDAGQAPSESGETLIPAAEFTMLPVPEKALDHILGAGCYYGNGEVFYVDTAEFLSDSQEGNEQYETRSCLFATAADGTGSTRMIAEGIPDLSIGSFFIDQNQFLYLYEYKTLFDPNTRKPITTSYLRKIDADGTEVYRIDLSQAMSEIFLGYAVQCFADREGNAALLDQTGEQVFFVHSSGEYLGRAETKNIVIAPHFNTNALVFIKDQGYYLWYADIMENKIKLWKVDFQNGLVSDKPVMIGMSPLKKADAVEFSSSDYVLFDGGEIGLLISTEDILWRYDLVTEELTEVFRWDDENVDLDGRLVSQIKWGMAGDDGTDMDLLIFESGTPGWFSNSMTVHISYVDRSQVPERQPVVIGLDHYYGNIKNLVRRFNRLNEEYRAEIAEYDSGELKERLMYGSAELPDLLEITGIRTEWLESKNLLEDLNPYLEKSELISREEILPSVLELLEEDGKLLSMAASFTIRTLITAADFMEEGRTPEEEHFAEGNWDYDRYLALGSLYPESWYFDMNGPANVWGSMSVTALDQFVDWKEHVCSFDSAEFKRLIEQINNLDYPVKPAGGNRPSAEENLMSRQVLFQYMTYGSPYDYDTRLNQSGGKIRTVGFPSADGTPVFLFSASQNLAIYAESPNKDGAWAFMEFLLSADEQSWYSSSNDVFPVRRDSFEAYLTRAYSYLEEDMVHSLDLSRKDTPEKLRYMTEHLGMNQNDSEISTIVSEELQAYFRGQKTADETAKIIQSRAQLYLDEIH